MDNNDGLDVVKVRKDTLLERLRHNRDGHTAKFNKAVEGYRAALLKELEERVDTVRKGHVQGMRVIQMIEPEDHTEDYDRIIDMLEMSITDEINITQREFQMYVRDDWAWSGKFSSDIGTYGVR